MKVLLVTAVLAAVVGGAASFAQGDVPACGADAPFTFTLTAEGRAFDYTTLALPARVEVALTLDNRDEDVTHSVIFYAAYSPEPYHPDGCLCGCGGDGPQLRSEPVTGVARQTFTFESPPPGRYVFWCDYHPDVMVGELVVLE